MATNAEDVRFRNLLDMLFEDETEITLITDQKSTWLTFVALCIACHHPELSDEWQDAMTDLAVGLAMQYNRLQPELDELVDELLHMRLEKS